MSRKKRETGSGRTRGTGAACGVALLVALAAPALVVAQERDRGRWDDAGRAMMRFRGAMMSRGLLGIGVGYRQAETDARGAEVRSIVRGGPADEAGLREGDIVTSLNGHSLLEALSDSDLEDRVNPDRSVPSQRLRLLAGELEPGAEATLEYLRDGEAASATLEVAENRGWAMPPGLDDAMMEDVRARAREAQAHAREMAERAREMAEEVGARWDEYVWIPEGGSALAVAGLRAAHGVSLVTLNPGLGRYFSAESGALVTEADEDNPLGLEAGDVIRAIGARAIDSAADARRILRSYEEGEEVTLTVMRDRAEIEVGGAVGNQARLRRGGDARGAPAGPPGARMRAMRRAPGRGAAWRVANRGGRPWMTPRR